MGEMQRQALLRKSNDASRGNSAVAAPSTGSAVERGLPLIFARAAEDCFALPLLVTTLSAKALRIEDIQQALPESGLYMLLEGPQGATGGLIVDLATVCAVLEHLTMGRVLGRDPDPDRLPTAVDAALVSSVFDALLQSSDDTFAQNDIEEWPAGHRFGSMVEDARTLMLSLAGTGFTSFDLDLSIGAANVACRAKMILPNEDLAQQDEHSPEALAAKAALFRENVMLAPAELNAVLHRITLPFDKLAALKVGDTLEIPLSALQNCALEIHQNETISKAALGQMNGQRAIKLILPASPAETSDQPEAGPTETANITPLPTAPQTPETAETKKAPPVAEPLPSTPDPEQAAIENLDIDDLDQLTDLS